MGCTIYVHFSSPSSNMKLIHHFEHTFLRYELLAKIASQFGYTWNCISEIFRLVPDYSAVMFLCPFRVPFKRHWPGQEFKEVVHKNIQNMSETISMHTSIAHICQHRHHQQWCNFFASLHTHAIPNTKYVSLNTKYTTQIWRKNVVNMRYVQKCSKAI